MTTDGPHFTPLSPAGQARRDEILVRAQRALRARLRRKITAATAMGALSIAIGTTGFVLARLQPGATSPAVAHRAPDTSANAPPAPVASASRIQLIPADPTVLERSAIVALPTRTEFLDDRALVDALAQAGVPAGVIRTPDRVTIAPIVRSASLPPPPSAGDPGALPAAPTG